MNREIGNENATLMNSASPISERKYQSLVVEYNNSAVAYPAGKINVDLF